MGAGDAFRSLFGGQARPTRGKTGEAVDRAIASINRMSAYLVALEQPTTGPDLAVALLRQCETSLLEAAREFAEAGRQAAAGEPMTAVTPAPKV